MGTYIGDENEAQRLIDNFVKECNQSTEIWADIQKKLSFVIYGYKISQQLCMSNIEIESLKDLCIFKAKLICEYFYYGKGINLLTTKIYDNVYDAAPKLKIPVDLLNNIFDKFAEYGNLSNNDFISNFVWDKDEKKWVYRNSDFACLCAIIYQTLYDLYGEDACEDKNFKSNMEKLFTDEQMSGFRKLVGKLVNFESFCSCCKNLSEFTFTDDWKDEYPSYVKKIFEDFQSKMKSSGLNLLGLFGKQINKTETTELNIENEFNEKKNITTPKLKNENKILLEKNLILILLIGLTALASLLFGMNIKFLFITFITNPLSIIITVVAIALFIGLTIYANKVKAIRLEKLYCGKESDGKPFFDIYKNIDDEIPNQNKKISLPLNKN